MHPSLVSEVRKLPIRIHHVERRLRHVWREKGVKRLLPIPLGLANLLEIRCICILVLRLIARVVEREGGVHTQSISAIMSSMGGGPGWGCPLVTLLESLLEASGLWEAGALFRAQRDSLFVVLYFGS